MLSKRLVWLAIITVSLVLSGCKYLPKFDDVLPDKRKEYQKSEELPDLEVPPDLSSESITDTMAVPQVDESGVGRFSTYQERVEAKSTAVDEEAAGEGEAPDSESESNAQPQLQSQSSASLPSRETLLVVKGEPGGILPRLRSFWEERGYTLDIDDRELGVQKTGWLENRAELARDRFELYVEAGEKPGTTAIHITHEGEEMKPDGEDLGWQERPRDESLEGKISSSLKTYLAGQSSAGSGSRQATLLSAGEGKKYLLLSEGPDTAWQRVGVALDQAGLKVKDKDASRGVYHVRYETANPKSKKEKKSFWSRLAFWSDDENQDYQVSLTDVGNNRTEVVVLDDDGDWDDSETAAQILGALAKELN